ncbi:hypothetical protein NQ024_13580, partial [Corynebacterium sp. 35RC1]|nr:hypothetical protein [Corynebacterium sp. 35RC1]
PKKKGRWLTALAVAAAAGGAAFVVARRKSADQGSQWQAARPSTPYVPPATTTGAATAGATAAADLTTEPSVQTDAVGADLGGAQSTETAEMYGQPIGDRADDDVVTDAESEMTERVERQTDADEEVPPAPTDSDALEGLNVVT